jgi:hypothetical protein
MTRDELKKLIKALDKSEDVTVEEAVYLIRKRQRELENLEVEYELNWA